VWLEMHSVESPDWTALVTLQSKRYGESSEGNSTVQVPALLVVLDPV